MKSMYISEQVTLLCSVHAEELLTAVERLLDVE